MKLLIINPGSTSTKVSLYEDRQVLFEENIFHDAPELLKFPDVNSQLPMRRELIIRLVEKHGYAMDAVDVFVGRGGSAYPQPAGVTEVDAGLVRDTAEGVGGSDHPARLGVMLAWDFAGTFGRKAYTMNPTNVDELCDEARLTGIEGVYRNAQSHVLNQKAVAALYARELGKKYEECRLIVSHIDGGITVNAHLYGRMIDGNVGAGGDGAFSPTRIGSMPVLPLLAWLESHSVEELRAMCSRSGGFVSFFGTSSADSVHRMAAEGDPKAALVWSAMVYQICKQIGAMSTVLCGRVDGIILTGGLIRFKDITDGIRRRCGWIAPIWIHPGEMEQQTMAFSVLNALEGNEPILRYSGRPVWDGFDFGGKEEQPS